MPSKVASRPRYGRFLFSGAVVGFLVSAVLLAFFNAGESDRTELTIMLTVFLAGIGALIGGGLAVLLEGRRSARRRAAQDAGTAPREP